MHQQRERAAALQQVFQLADRLAVFPLPQLVFRHQDARQRIFWEAVGEGRIGFFCQIDLSADLGCLGR